MVIFLTGAPQSSSLDWTIEALNTPLLPCFSTSQITSKVQKAEATVFKPTWRSLPFERKHLPTGLTQPNLQPECHIKYTHNSEDYDETTFLDTAELSLVSDVLPDDNSELPPRSDEAIETLSQYYEYSFAVHEEVPSSQIFKASSSEDKSFFTASSSPLAYSVLDLTTKQVDQTPKAKPVSGSLSDLENVPSAAYLQTINPQTMTVNLIVGIIAVPQPRIIYARRGRRLELVEMIVGDETRAGFNINIWLPPTLDDSDDGRGLRSVISKLRPRDVILARNVALSSFRRRVYGQSLRKDITKLDLMYRNACDKQDEIGAYDEQELKGDYAHGHQAAKVKKVRDWIMDFVGASARALGQRQENTNVRTKNEGRAPLLPPDTQ
ncbi:hypothetical protein MMC06_003571 [Schaereria dolodes]|nr:hypothetical protein [Schaereria dolodes]